MVPFLDSFTCNDRSGASWRRSGSHRLNRDREKLDECSHAASGFWANFLLDGALDSIMIVATTTGLHLRTLWLCVHACVHVGK